MITNREEVLEKAFKVFVKMNYEKASFTEIAKACGLSRAGIIHYFPYKLDLFVAVVDKFVFQMYLKRFYRTVFERCNRYHEAIGGINR